MGEAKAQIGNEVRKNVARALNSKCLKTKYIIMPHLTCTFLLWDSWFMSKAVEHITRAHAKPCQRCSVGSSYVDLDQELKKTHEHADSM